MKGTISQQILEKHLVEGTLKQGEEIGIKIDQTLTQDATGTMAYLQFEALDIPKVKTELSVSVVDHNTLQTDFRNADDHRYLQSIAAKFGIYFSRPGNGICHQVYLERFARPTKTLLGSDSHTPTAGGIGSLAIGAGGLDVAVAMGGGLFYLKTPKIVGVNLSGELKPWVSAKDVILELLRQLTVKGGVGKIMEYFGDGVKTLSVPERATITNMGAELGATTSIFPSDKITKSFLKAQGREKDWVELKPNNAEYDEVIELNLEELEPMIAKPHSPGNVVKVTEVEGTKVDQVIIGSCTNSSFKDMMTVAELLKGKTIHPEVSFSIAPGSRQVLEMLAKNSALADIIAAGARILETACGPCIGMGQAPKTDAVTLRTFNRNFEGRCGTKSGQAYLCSPEVAVAAALEGKITDPRKLGDYPKIDQPESFDIDDSMILPPSDKNVEIVRGPNIQPLPKFEKLPDKLSGKVLLKVEDNITTDHIMPAGAKILPLRSNIPEISKFVYTQVDETFYDRAMKEKGGFIVGGENYGQGSSREHAALAPKYLGIKAVIVKSFARIHKANLVNFGILPLEFANPDDYKKIKQDDKIDITDVRKNIEAKEFELTAGKNKIKVKLDVAERDIEIILAGGLLNYTKANAK